ncbi:MAG: bifunctional riboflavin kinase/FAD synthetase [Bacteroidetes bacterium]|nr:bifunctional riboflavin kinase/FAD synthetase [Bacteroidota bacterium]
MHIYHSVSECNTPTQTIVTIGTFDGVHLGHKTLIQELNKIAFESSLTAVILTFNPHPRLVIFPDDNGLQLLNTLEEKIELFRTSGVQHLIIHPFTKEFSRLSSADFVRNILHNQLKVKKLIIGHDHHFGRNRQGSIAELEELAPLYDFEVTQLNEVTIGNTVISSTKIRNALLDGKVEVANKYLGYSYALTGAVIHGKKLGRTLGFPTANMAVVNTKLIPSNGVYAVTVTINDEPITYYGLLSIGNRPTFDNGEKSVEVFIINFDRDIYERTITVTLQHFLRTDQKFNSADELITQMKKDKVQAEEIFGVR